MSEQEIIDGNKAIEIFKADNSANVARYVNSKSDSYCMNILCYHKDWSLLMPVVEKIELIEYEDKTHKGKDKSIDISDFAYLRTFHRNVDTNLQMVRINRSALFQAETRIEATWLAVVDFIKWYNL